MAPLSSAEIIRAMEQALEHSQVIDQKERAYDFRVVSSGQGFFRWEFFQGPRRVGHADLEVQPGNLHIHDMFLDVPFRRVGLGAAVMDRLAAAAGNICCTSISGTLSENDLESFPGLPKWLKTLGYSVEMVKSRTAVSARYHKDLAG